MTVTNTDGGDGYLSRAVFDANFPAIAAEVLTLTRAASGHRARVLVCREEGSKEPVAEVWQTTWGRVVRYRDGRHELNRKMDAYMPFRRGEWALEPLTGDRRQFFEVFSRSNAYGIAAGELVDRIESGRRVVMVRKADRPAAG